MLNYSPDIIKAYQFDKTGRTITVTIVVKTTPLPSNRHEETVCVAGIAHNPYRWVRLYPVRFRDLERHDQFKKYETIRVPVRAPSNDARNESLRLDGNLEIIGSLHKDWNTRATLLANFPPVTLCALQHNITHDANGHSLAVVRPRNIPTLTIEPHPGWTPREREIIEKWAQPTLDVATFTSSRTPLEPPRYRIHINFTCKNEDTCNGHSISLTDWEGTALQRRIPADATIDYVHAQVIRKFITEKFKPGRTTQIIVGNQARGTKRKSFLALGIFGPYNEPQPTLF
ncbi:hypothetical protein [Actinobaculum sp. 352]|uniref:hypothetical protein n=1 Tax=Actinobaculum sp. 352 TaxID=2490946 RepID=UPI000F7EB9FC|nr:hypothetical protein [Actinobaculum sp. 352]RTE49185.1 hypothetical protein EKN07_06300 [Actinobaculum sp. 352]